jgi:polysaccharide deacetylase 2 family uncharacterized protein YibQ
MLGFLHAMLRDRSNQYSEEKDLVKEHDVVSHKTVDLPEEIMQGDAMKRILQDGLALQEAIQTEVSDIFENPLSPFSQLEEGIIVTRKEPHKQNITPKPRVVIIIDDMGVSQEGSHAIIELPAPLTLSFLPYGDGVQMLADRAKHKGHQLMLHMPMQAMNGAMETTPGLLRVTDDLKKFSKIFQQNLDSFDGFLGLNNHMGSLLTQDTEKMSQVMRFIKEHNLYFVDSRTIHSSVAGQAAAAHDVPFLARDIFLDHEDTLSYVNRALKNLEYKARKEGVAIAIGHPKSNTIKALRNWLPSLREKNIELVGAETLIRERFPGNLIKPYERSNLSTNAQANFQPVHITVEEADR